MLTINDRSGHSVRAAGPRALSNSGRTISDDDSLVRIANGILGSHDLACDAVQEAKWSFHCHGVEAGDRGAWLRKAVVNRSLHAARSERRRNRYEGLAARTVGCPLCDPVAELEFQELSRALVDSLKRLCAEHRAVLRLRAQDGLDYEAIANRLGISVGTVRSRLSRARSILKRQLGSKLPSAMASVQKEVV